MKSVLAQGADPRLIDDLAPETIAHSQARPPPASLHPDFPGNGTEGGGGPFLLLEKVGWEVLRGREGPSLHTGWVSTKVGRSCTPIAPPPRNREAGSPAIAIFSLL